MRGVSLRGLTAMGILQYSGSGGTIGDVVADIGMYRREREGNGMHTRGRVIWRVVWDCIFQRRGVTALGMWDIGTWGYRNVGI